MDWPLVVLLIVLIGATTSLLQAKIAAGKARHRAQPAISGEGTHRVEEEVRALKDRVAVLERIATDREHLLEQQFEQLRDR